MTWMASQQHMWPLIAAGSQPEIAATKPWIPCPWPSSPYCEAVKDTSCTTDRLAGEKRVNRQRLVSDSSHIHHQSLGGGVGTSPWSGNTSTLSGGRSSMNLQASFHTAFGVVPLSRPGYLPFVPACATKPIRGRGQLAMVSLMAAVAWMLNVTEPRLPFFMPSDSRLGGSTPAPAAAGAAAAPKPPKGRRVSRG